MGCQARGATTQDSATRVKLPPIIPPRLATQVVKGSACKALIRQFDSDASLQASIAQWIVQVVSTH
jgi:hypothetical protein